MENKEHIFKEIFSIFLNFAISKYKNGKLQKILHQKFAHFINRKVIFSKSVFTGSISLTKLTERYKPNSTGNRSIRS